MTRESKLYPDQMKAQCASACGILTTENTNLSDLKSTVAAFVEDTEIKSFSFDQLKAQCENYLEVIDAMIEVNKQDIADYNTLSVAVGSEVLLGDQILSNQEKFHGLMTKALEMRTVCESRAAVETVSGTADFYREMAAYWNEMAEGYEYYYDYWVEKEKEYDRIEAETCGLFAGSSAIRTVLNRMLEGLQDSFHMNTGQYNPDGIKVTKFQLDCIRQGKIDMANGIRALDHYMIQSGQFNPEERSAILKAVLEQAPEKLSSLSHIVSMADAEVAEITMQNLVEAHMPLEVAMDRWNKAAHTVGQAYLNNVPTYCGRKTDEPGYGRADQRKGYVLEGVEGNLKDIKVYDDCSSFVYACLIQADRIPKKDFKEYPPTSRNYLPGGSIEDTLQESGFVWHDSKELTPEEIQKGDILVRSTHVEIFHEYDAEDRELAYTWGMIYDREPASKSTKKSNILQYYEGVWRYEGN